MREVLASTVGADDEHLLEHRMERVTVDLLVDNILLDLDSDPYDDAFHELDRREDEVPEPDDVPDAPTPPGFEWVNDRDEHGLATWMDDPEKVAAVLVAETPPRPLTPGEKNQQEALNRIAALRERA